MRVARGSSRFALDPRRRRVRISGSAERVRPRRGAQEEHSELLQAQVGRSRQRADFGEELTAPVVDRRGVRDRFRAAASGEALDHLLRQPGKILIGESDDGIDGLCARELLREIQAAIPLKRPQRRVCHLRGGEPVGGRETLLWDFAYTVSTLILSALRAASGSARPCCTSRSPR